MKKIKSEFAMRKIFEALGNDEYSPLWWVTEDMAYNGHVIEVQASSRFNHVVIDDCYYRIAPNDGKVMCGVAEFPERSYTPLDYVMEVVLSKPRTEDRDVKQMIDSGYERDKQFERLEDAEDYVWRDYVSKSKKAQILREFVDNDEYCGFLYTVWI